MTSVLYIYDQYTYSNSAREQKLSCVGLNLLTSLYTGFSSVTEEDVRSLDCHLYKVHTHKSVLACGRDLHQG
jgi:hypothetical protein